jgi:2-polyprenyl-6-hydroxyphenyl methylase/3-demethylubiquinone-9 3-methyltransferase
LATAVNNEVYRTLGDRWYTADDDPIALLRAEARLHAPWIAERVGSNLPGTAHRILDLGCGAGLVANDLVQRGFEVLGVDLAAEALEVAARHDPTGRARWLLADVRALPLPAESFDVVCAMDLLEHVEPVDAVIGEVARILRPGGLFFFHTFNRTWLSWLVVIKGVELFVRNVPPDLHVHRAFVKPEELSASCAERGLQVRELYGCAPRLSLPLLRLLVDGVVAPNLGFHFTKRTSTGYSGIAKKLGSARAQPSSSPDGVPSSIAFIKL